MRSPTSPRSSAMRGTTAGVRSRRGNASGRSKFNQPAECWKSLKALERADFSARGGVKKEFESATGKYCPRRTGENRDASPRCSGVFKQSQVLTSLVSGQNQT